MAISELIDALAESVPEALANEEPPPAIEESEVLRAMRREENREQIGGPFSAVDRNSPGPFEAGTVEPGVRRLSKGQRERIDGCIREAGFEAVAWYVSYHWNRNHWGIFLSEQGMRRIAEKLADASGRSHNEMLPLARDLLVAHEQFHFDTDVASTSLEIALRAPLYVPRHRLVARTTGYDHLEESLANACAFERTTHWGLQDPVSVVLRDSPPGYADFESHLGKARPDDGLRRLMDDLLHSATGGGRPGLVGLDRLLDWEDLTGDSTQVPVWLVHDSPNHRAVRFAARLGELTISKRFAKDLAKAERRTREAWERTAEKLGNDTTDPGLKFEKVRGSKNRYTVRVDLSIRARLMYEGGRWVAERLGTHDLIYGGR